MPSLRYRMVTDISEKVFENRSSFIKVLYSNKETNQNKIDSGVNGLKKKWIW